MFDFTNILAQQESDPIMKIVFFVVFALIWGIGALAKMLSKKKEHEHRERVRRELEESRRSAPDWGDIASTPPVPQRSVPPVLREPPRPVQIPSPPPWQQNRAPTHRAPTSPQRPPPVPQQRQPKQAKKPKKKPQPPALAGKPFADAPVPAATAVPKVTGQTAPLKVNAGELRSWLRPNTLRDQFILTEILQPPLAMRQREIN